MGGTESCEGLRDPLERTTARLLRQAVLDHARTERRPRSSPVLHVGTPGERAAALTLDGTEPTDPGLRTDVVAALRVAHGGWAPLVWLTRVGDPHAALPHAGLQDVDARWLAAARSAYAELQRPLTFVVVTRKGWWDPRSGLSRSWVRIR